MVEVRIARPEDNDAIWEVLEPVFRAGETYAIDPDISQEDATTYWTGGTHTCFVAVSDEEILGTYYIRPNQGGHGAHICNCGYITAPAVQGRGIATAMLEHSFKEAAQMGFYAMQYNFVLANNIRALEIWTRYGFQEIGRIPNAFNHPSDGFIEALILHKPLRQNRSGNVT